MRRNTSRESQAVRVWRVTPRDALNTHLGVLCSLLETLADVSPFQDAREERQLIRCRLGERTHAHCDIYGGMSSVWKRIQRVGKRASKFQFAVTYQSLTIELTSTKW